MLLHIYRGAGVLSSLFHTPLTYTVCLQEWKETGDKAVSSQPVVNEGSWQTGSCFPETPSHAMSLLSRISAMLLAADALYFCTAT